MGISHSILQAHGAELHVESETGKGTVIIVRFPVAGPPMKPHAAGPVFGKPAAR
jgi:signal transduction histidine kinase